MSAAQHALGWSHVLPSPLRIGRVLFVLAALASTGTAAAQPEPTPTPASAPAPTPIPTMGVSTAPKAAAQGVAVLASGATRDDAFALARAVYGSSLRPRALDELRARILGGDPAPVTASKELRELAELRASIVGDDAASRRLLTSIAQQLGVQGILVVSRARATEQPAEPAPAADADAGTSVPSAPAPAPAPTSPPAVARLFLAETGDFDAARYEPDPAGGPNAWRGTVTSLSGRFPPPPVPAATAQLRGPPPKLSSEGKDNKPFYTSPWLWGAIGAAALIGGFFYFASQDTSSDPIHLQMRVPR